MIAYMIIAMGAGFLLSYFLSGIALALIFLLIWVDKAIIGYTGILHRFGIELTTVTTVFLGLLFGALFAFVFSLVVIVLAHGFKRISFPSMPGEWPPFVPYPYNFIDAVGAATAAIVKMSVLPALLIVLAVKVVLYIIVDRMAFGKPPDFIGGMTNVVFNLAVFLPISQFFIAATGAALLI